MCWIIKLFYMYCRIYNVGTLYIIFFRRENQNFMWFISLSEPIQEFLRICFYSMRKTYLWIKSKSKQTNLYLFGKGLITLVWKMILFFLTFGLIRAKTGAKHRCEDYEIFEGVDFGFDEKYSSIRRLRVWNSTIPVRLTREWI